MRHIWKHREYKYLNLEFYWPEVGFIFWIGSGEIELHLLWFGITLFL